MMQAGCNVRTMVHRIDCYWDTLGDARDFKYAGEIGLWVARNEKVLDKRRETEVVQLVQEQFPTLKLVTSRDDHGRLARIEA
jgi:hypothetical protein